MAIVAAEGEWMVTLDAEARARFLACLGYELTIAGRDSYVVQGNGLSKPELLRRINEIQHRILACLSQLLAGVGDPDFERSIALWVLDCSNSDIQSWGLTAWNTAKERVHRAN